MVYTSGNVEPRNITVRVPVGTRYKGMGKPKRMKSKREKAISQAGKKRRQCQNCWEYGHNIRTCKNPTKAARDAQDDTSEDTEQDEDENDDVSEESAEADDDVSGEDG